MSRPKGSKNKPLNVAKETVKEMAVVKKEPKRGIILKVLQQLEVDNGIVSPHDLVDLARSENHPLHTSFEWDDQEGAERYRLMQARIMINSVRVEFMGEQREAFFNVVVPVKSVPTRGYVSLERVISNKELHRQALQKAIEELEYWQKKYNSLSELRGVTSPTKLARVKRKIQKA